MIPVSNFYAPPELLAIDVDGKAIDPLSENVITYVLYFRDKDLLPVAKKPTPVEIDLAIVQVERYKQVLVQVKARLEEKEKEDGNSD